jgi:hypothetical protein
VTAHPPSFPRARRALALGLCGLAVALAGCGGGGGGGVCAGFRSPGMGSGASSTVAGTVAYQDWLQDASGFTGVSQARPVREAKVQVVRCSDGAVLGSDVSTDAGAFSVDVTNTGDVGAYVRVLAQVNDADYSLAVKDTHLAVYAVRGSPFDERTAPPQALYATASAGIGPPFNILEDALEAVRYVRDNLALAGPLQGLTLEWEANKTNFTAFCLTAGGGCPGARTVVILDQPNAAAPDTDGYDDMVIRHETGHFIASQISDDDSPGGPHYSDETDQDARLAWSEGWANFFGGAVADNPDYVDTFDPVPGGGALTFSLEDLAPGFAGGSTSELGVTATLWDGLDGTVSVPDMDSDGSALGPGPILAAMAALKGHPAPVDFGAFWNALRTDTGTATPDLDAFRTAAHDLDGIDLFEDDGTDDDPATATILGAPPVILDANLAWDATGPATVDLDHYKVTLTAGVPYTIETTDLSDGADTLVQVLDAAGSTLLDQNDNYSGASYAGCDASCPPNGPYPTASSREPLSSRVLFTPTATATYVVRVTRSATPPPSAGLFGGYRLHITP